MDLKLTFGRVPGDDFDTSTYMPRSLVGLSAEDVTSIATEEARALDPAATAALKAGSIGKGASGPGAELVLHIAETVLNDGASVFAWGTVLWSVIRRIQKRQPRALVVQDATTISLLAAAADASHQQRLVGASVGVVVPLSGGPGLGMDGRDIWLTSFWLPSADLWVVFTATDGRVLGEVIVPAPWSEERGTVEGPALAQLFRRLNS